MSGPTKGGNYIVQSTSTDAEALLKLKRKLVVLCLNDFPIGVYSSSEAADAAALKDWKQREQPDAPWKPKGMKLGQSFDGRIGPYMKYYYHQHEFVVDAEAHL